MEAQSLKYWTYRAAPRDKCLRDHIHSLGLCVAVAVFAPWLGWIASIETICPEKSKIFTLWPFPEHVCQLLYLQSFILSILPNTESGSVRIFSHHRGFAYWFLHFSQFLFCVFGAVLWVTQVKTVASSSRLTCVSHGVIVCPHQCVLPASRLGLRFVWLSLWLVFVLCTPSVLLFLTLFYF